MVDFGSVDYILWVVLAIVAIVIFLKVAKYIFLIAIVAVIYFAWKYGLFKSVGLG